MRVLVTRLEPGATTTAARLAERGHEPVVLPLTRTLPLEFGPVPDPAAFDAVIATSAAAIRHAPAALIARTARLPLHMVGERTAAAATAAGFRDVAVPAPNADSLAEALPARLPAGARLLYLAGRLRTGALAARLQAAGFPVTILEVYDTVADEDGFDDAAALVGARPLDAALVYSAYSAAMLSRLAARPELAANFAAARFLCISQRVAEALDGELAARAEIAATPDEASLLALLEPA